LVSRVVLSLYGGGRSRVQTRGLPTMFCIPYEPNKWGHVAPMCWATCILLIRLQVDTCRLPTGQQSTNQRTPRHHDGTALHVAVRTVRTGTVSIPFFDLFDLAIKSRYLLHTDSIRENEYTAGIRKTRRTQWYWFRLNPSTLKFEQILIP
jgi:hypothetical protein